MISYLINAMIDTISPEEKKEDQPRQSKKKDDLVDRKTLNRIKNETFHNSTNNNNNDGLYFRRSQLLLNDISTSYRPSYYNTTAPFVTTTEKTLGGWVCYNDKNLCSLIESFPELNIMPKGDVRFWINANWKNVDRVILLYFYADGEDEKLNGLLSELRNSTNGNVFLICLTETGSGPFALNTMIPKSYITLRARRSSGGYIENVILDEESRNQISEFIKSELSKSSELGGRREIKDLAADILAKDRTLATSSYLLPEEGFISTTIPTRKTESYAYTSPALNYSNPYYNTSDLGVGEVITSNRTYNFDPQQPSRVERVEKQQLTFAVPNIQIRNENTDDVIYGTERIVESPTGAKTRVFAPSNIDIQYIGTGYNGNISQAYF